MNFSLITLQAVPSFRAAMRMSRWPVAALSAGAGAVLAHEAPGLAPATLGRAWNTELWLWLLWLVPGLLVVRGITLMWANARPDAGVRR